MPHADHGGPPGDVPAGSSLEDIARELNVDAGEIEPRLDPFAPAGDLKTEIERFTTIEACVAQHAQIDPVLGDALDAVGYGTFVHDACRVLGAAKASDARRCDAIDSSALRDRCLSTVAELAATPDACPWDVADKPAEGRDPACVAIASRSAALCSAVLELPDQTTCEAVTSGDASRCNKLRRKVDKERCSRQAQRWRAALASPSGAASAIDAAAASAVSGKLVVHEAANAGAPAATVEADLSASLARGVVLVEQRDGTRLAVGPLTPEGPGWTLPSPYAGTSFAIELFVPASESNATGARTAQVDRAELLVPNRLGLATPIAHSTLSARIDKLVPARGGAVVLVVDGDLQEGPSIAHVHAEEATFVRDVVRAPAVLSLDGGLLRYLRR